MERYKLLENLGEGYFATVHKAIQISTKQVVAIKIYHPEDTPEDMEDMLREVSALVNIESEYIVKYLESFMIREKWEKERERDRDKEKDRERDRDKDRERDRDKDKDKDRDKSDRDRDKDRERDRDKDRERDREKDRDKSDRERDKDRERDRDKDKSERDRDKDKSEREREREREKERERREKEERERETREKEREKDRSRDREKEKEQPRLVVVMEYMSCRSLERCVKITGNLSENIVAAAFRDILFGLDYLHSSKRAHRNIRGANLLLNDAGQAKLAVPLVGGSLGDATRLRSVVSAPYWMSPEALSHIGREGKVTENKPNSPPSNNGSSSGEISLSSKSAEKLSKQDIWSLGITAIELVTGRPPHYGKDPLKVLMAVSKEDPPLLEGADFSKNFKDFVYLCLNKDPKKRPSARELLSHPFIKRAKRSYLVSLVEKVEGSKKQPGKSSRRAETPEPSSTPITPSSTPNPNPTPTPTPNPNPESHSKMSRSKITTPLPVPVPHIPIPSPPAITESSSSLLPPFQSTSLISNVILPSISKQQQSHPELSPLLEKLKDTFVQLEQNSEGITDQLLNQIVQTMLWENYNGNKGSAMSNYLLVRWKNNTKL